MHRFAGWPTRRDRQYRPLRRAPLYVLLATAFLAAMSADHAERLECREPNVVVHSPQRDDALLACAAATDALSFLAQQGFDTSAHFDMRLVSALPLPGKRSVVGFYLEAERRIFAVLYAEFTKQKDWFRLPITRDLYRALITHEVAHAVADRNFRVTRPSIQAKEYIAYVTMFATMTTSLREQILSQFPGEGFRSEPEMNTTIYLADPMRFGVQAYRHFAKLGEGKTDYLQAILSGKVLTE